MKDKRIKEIFAGSEEMIKKALDLEISYNIEFLRTIFTKNKEYRFSIKLEEKSPEGKNK